MEHANVEPGIIPLLLFKGLDIRISIVPPIIGRGSVYHGPGLDCSGLYWGYYRLPFLNSRWQTVSPRAREDCAYRGVWVLDFGSREFLEMEVWDLEGLGLLLDEGCNAAATKHHDFGIPQHSIVDNQD